METGRFFPDGESYFRTLSDVAGRPVDLACTLASPDDGFLRLAFVADAARALGASEVTLIAPYLSYVRQDRRFQPGVAMTSKTFARFLPPTFGRLETVEPQTIGFAKEAPEETMWHRRPPEPWNEVGRAGMESFPASDTLKARHMNSTRRR